MKIFINCFNRKTGTKLTISDDESYSLGVTEKGELYVVSLTEKDEDGWDRELDARFEVIIK